MNNPIIQKTIEYIRSLRLGHIGQQYSEEILLQTVYHWVPEGYFQYSWLGQYQLRIELSEELIKLGISKWDRYQSVGLLSVLCKLALKVHPHVNTTMNWGAGIYTQKLLEEIYKAIKPAKTVAQYQLEPPQKMVSLLDALLPFSDKEKHLTIKVNEKELHHIKFLLLPILHYCRRKAPIDTLHWLESRGEVWKSDYIFYSKLQQLEHQLLKQLDKPPRKPLAIKWSPPPQRDPLDRLTIWQQLHDHLLYTRDFLFGSDTAGPTRLVHIGLIVVLSTTISILAYQAGNTLLTSKKVEHVITYDYMTRSKNTVPDFVKHRSKYTGNQLPTGVLAFPRCFEEGVYDESSGNELSLINNTEYDAVACVYAIDSFLIVRHAYLRRGEQLQMQDFPKGAYTIRYYFGKNWNPLKPNFCGLHGAFDTQPHYRKRSKYAEPLTFTLNTHKSVQIDQLTIEEGIFPKISASTYFKNRNRGLPVK